MNKHLIFIIVAILGTETSLVAQTPHDGKSNANWLILPEQGEPSTKAVDTSQPRNEWDWLAISSYKFYKKYISSQDAISCTFEPSCSTYGLHALRHLGAFTGLAATFDRLARCHGWNRGAYDVDASSGLNLDPLLLLHPNQKNKKIQTGVR